MKILKQLKSLNFIVHLSIFVVTQVTGLLLSLSICFILQDFIWGFLRIAMINSFILGISLIGCCILSQKLIFKIKTVYIIFISFSVILGTSIISFVILLYSEPTLFIYYYRGAISFLFVNFLFIMALYIISSGLIIYREIMVEKEKAIGNERHLKNQMERKLLSSLEEHNRTLEKNLEQLNKEIVERERIEKLAREQQEKLIQSDKMASVGILVSGVAHEINNPNNFMLLNSNNLADVWNDINPFLDKYCEENGDVIIAGMPYSEIRDDVSMMIKDLSEGSERISKIVKTLKDFARKDTGNIDQIVDINAVIDASITILANPIKKSTDHFTTKLGKDLPKIKGNFQQIEQVVINLIGNSCQALEDRKKEICVITEFDDKSKRVIVTVRDEGKGISPNDMKHIMDPFFTTKRDTGGTGLGLSISYKIINDHHGELKFESEPGRGTTATIILPASGA